MNYIAIIIQMNDFVNDKVIVHVVAVKMKRHYNIVAGPRATGELQAHLDHFLRLDIFVGVERLNVVPKAQTVGLIPNSLVRHELLVRHLRVAVNA